jgi:hypothetical protein
MQDTQELSLIVNQAGLAQEKSQQLLAKFGEFFQDARHTVEFAKSIKVTSVDQVEEMKKARETRLELKSIRNQVENTRKELKEQSLREGKAIDGIANVIKALIVPVEQFLDEQEKFAERVEVERKNKIERQRILELSQYVENVQVYSLHPDKLSQESFDQLLKTSKVAYEAQKKAEKEAEEARIKAEQEEKAENERIRLENQKLKEAQEKREAEIAKERAKQEAALEAERKAKKALEDKIEADRLSKLKAETDQKRLEEEAREKKEKAERDALLAPDKEKLFELANKLNLIDLPLVKSSEAKAVVGHVELELAKLANYIRNSKL